MTTFTSLFFYAQSGLNISMFASFDRIKTIKKSLHVGSFFERICSSSAPTLNLGAQILWLYFEDNAGVTVLCPKG